MKKPSNHSLQTKLNQPAINYSALLQLFGLVIGLSVVAASMGQTDWVAYGLHQVSTLLAVVLLCVLGVKTKVRFISALGAFGFLLIHILGAAYLYSYVPYNEWILALTGFDLNQSFGFERNMYDRLVHFSYGFLLFSFMLDVLNHYVQASTKTLIVLVLSANMAGSMIYEVIEWLIGVGFAPEQAENYNGQQGDVWDPQKDMLIALVGGVLAAIFSRNVVSP